MSRRQPNILITGTPGTGKTTISENISRKLNLRHVCLGDWVKAKDLHTGWDEEFQSFIVDEDKVQQDARVQLHRYKLERLFEQVCDELEDLMEQGGVVVDYHGCDFFPERYVCIFNAHTSRSRPVKPSITRWFDLVVVLQTDNTILYDRLEKRYFQLDLKPSITRPASTAVPG